MLYLKFLRKIFDNDIARQLRDIINLMSLGLQELVIKEWCNSFIVYFTGLRKHGPSIEHIFRLLSAATWGRPFKTW